MCVFLFNLNKKNELVLPSNICYGFWAQATAAWRGSCQALAAQVELGAASEPGATGATDRRVGDPGAEPWTWANYSDLT